MNRICRQHPVCPMAGVLAVLATALPAAATTLAALALPVLSMGGDGTVQPLPVRTIVVGGMPGWQIALIAAGAAVVAATSAVLVDRARADRRHLTAPNTWAGHRTRLVSLITGSSACSSWAASLGKPGRHPGPGSAALGAGYGLVSRAIDRGAGGRDDDVRR
jgi:hypothetical protein